MANVQFPAANSEVVDPNRRPTIPWNNWFIALNNALAAGAISNATLTTALLKIVQSLGSTDNTADTIISVINTEITGLYPVIVTGDMRDGFLVKLPPGFGTATANSNSAAILLSSDFDAGEAWPQVAPAAAAVADTASDIVPYYIPVGEIFTVPANRQALYKMPISVAGSLVVNGYLVEID